MKKLSLWMLAAILTLCGSLMFTSCSLEDDPIVDPVEEPEEPQVTEPSVKASMRYEEQKLTVYNIEYPSTDPLGEPVMLSATITMGDEVNTESPALGLVLNSHFSVFRADQCPTRGYLDVEKMMVGSHLITISPDYYGFGCTEDKLQAYCISHVNAQASVDALLAAKKILSELGIGWNDDVLYNIGYSQGAQTAMGIVRLIDERYPDLKISCTIAGGGPYDIAELYRLSFTPGAPASPAIAISLLMAYNTYSLLDIPLERLLLDPPLSQVDEYILSKNYTRSEIDEAIGLATISDICTSAVTDFSSSIAQRFLTVMEQDNLCTGWTPRTDEQIILVHHTKDTTVPVVNASKLYQFLKAQGVQNVTYYVGDFGSIKGKPAHESGASIMAMRFINKVCTDLGLFPWIDPSNIIF